MLTGIAQAAAIALVLLTFANLWCCLGKRHFTGLYWFSILAVFCAPAAVDVFAGLPEEALQGSNMLYFPFAENGRYAAVIFALLHTVISSAVYWSLARGWPLGTQRPVEPSPSALRYLRNNRLLAVMSVCFVASALFYIVARFDLSRQFSDYMDANAAPEYQGYFYLASTPLAALLAYRRDIAPVWKWIVCFVAALTAYFIGIRYFMFPFVIFLAWTGLLELRQSVKLKMLWLALGTAAGWVVATLWGIVRLLNVRNDPLAIVNALGIDRILITLGRGNELTARLACYDIIGRASDSSYPRGLSAIGAMLLSSVYPAVLRSAGIPLPVSNSQMAYEITSGTAGTGVSTGMTMFGNDWFVWGWAGAAIGGVALGILLFLVDHMQSRVSRLWIVAGPMASFQLIFFARGGTDVWLNTWGRFLPITLFLLLLGLPIEGDPSKVDASLSRAPFAGTGRGAADAC